MPPRAPTLSAARQYLETQRAANAQLAKEREDRLLWIQSVWHIRGDQDRPYSIERYPFLRKPGTSKAPKLALMSSAGVGKTEFFLAYATAEADAGRRVLYAFESDGKTGLLVNERVNPNLKNSLYLSARCAETDNIKFKKFSKGFLYFFGMGTDSATTSIHVDTIILDEMDLMPGDKVAASSKRLTSSSSPREIHISNPWHDGAGIHKEFLEGDQQRWHLTCLSCQHRAPLEWHTHVDYTTASVRCPHCHKPMDRLAPGEWITTNAAGTYESYYIHGLMSPDLNLASACKELQSDDMEVVKAAWRFNVGLPFRFKDGGLTDQDLWAADGGGVWTKYAPGGFLVCDPGGLFDVQIFAKREPGRPTRCTWYGTVRGWVELRQLVEESGVDGGLIDYGPETKAALEFCEAQKARGRDFRRIAYKLRDTPGTPDFVADAHDPLLIAAQRTGACDQMVVDLRKGKLTFPSRACRSPLERWASHMKAPERVLEKDGHGNTRATWSEGNKPDHQFHCAVYASVWSRIESKARRSPSGVRSWGGH